VTIVRVILLVLASVIAPRGLAQEAGFEFALIGDNPYPQESIPLFERLVSDINAESRLEWVIHVGDIRGGRGSPSFAPCSDEILEERFALYQTFDAPFMFTPGDNDWWDCREMGGGFDEWERLQFLRETFYPEPSSSTGGRPIVVAPQSATPGFEDFVENHLWVRDDVVFSLFHSVVLTRTESAELTALHARIVDAAVEWIEQSFAQAAELNSPGVFLATQADLWRTGSVGEQTPRQGLERLYPALVEASANFGRPVVLAVGDTHTYRVDKPLRWPGTNVFISNFTRVEAFGHPHNHWVRVSVEPTTREVFSFRQEIIPENVIRP